MFSSITEIRNDIDLPLEKDTYGTSITWSSSNTSILSDTGVYSIPSSDTPVRLTATITYLDASTSCYYDVIAKNTLIELMALLANGHNDVVERKTINYIGYESGYESVAHNVYTSVNKFYAGSIPSVAQNRGSAVNSGTMTSIEFIVVHDTGSASPSSNAKANSNWCVSASNDQSSWHYTVGNDGIYQQLNDNIIAWHAGDGTDWASSTTLTNTGVLADSNLRNRAVVTLGGDGYFYVNGTKTSIPLPSGATSSTGTNQLGLAAIVKDGYYYLPTTYVGGGYGNKVCVRGGNLNGIGIESAVNTGSDVYLTWQYLAKFVAGKLVEHNLTPDRVLFHNNFSNKTCPNTMINANMVETFLDMVYLEYYIAKDYSDYVITFTSNNPSIVDNTGRVVGGGPSSDTAISYTITITHNELVETATFYSTVKGNN